MLWAGVAGLIFGAMHGRMSAIGTALAVAFGPLAGGYARDWQSCCAQNPLSLLAPGVLTAFLLRASTPARPLALWLASWASWSQLPARARVTHRPLSAPSASPR